MDVVFVLANADLDKCLEIPSGDDSGEFDPVELHSHCHGGESQLWQVGRGGRIVSVLDPTLCLGTFSTAGDLGARRVRDGESVVLVHLDSEFALTFRWGDGGDFGIRSSSDNSSNNSNNGKNSNNKINSNDDMKSAENEIICMQDTALRVGSAARGHGIEVQSSSRRGQTWTLTPPPTSPPKPQADPPNSCILRYCGVTDCEVEDSWTLRCKIDLRRSCKKCVVGWGPGGYCAIERVDHEGVVVAFATWNDEGTVNNVLKIGDVVTEDDCGGVPKSTLEVASIDEATFIVTGERCSQSEEGSWRCSGWFRASDMDESIFIATYERIGNQTPLSSTGIHIILDDWYVDPPKTSPKVALNGRVLNELSVTQVSVQGVD